MIPRHSNASATTCLSKNVIAFNGDDGVYVEGGATDLVRQNSVFGNSVPSWGDAGCSSWFERRRLTGAFFLFAGPYFVGV